MPHTIRLTGFWTRTDLGEGCVEFTRKFGRPRTLDPHETAWLVGHAAPGTGELIINGQTITSLARGARFEVNVTALLQVRNEAKLSVHDETTWGEVVLEIRSE
jgi:hypothetical protein